MNKFTWPVRVYYEDTDSGGVVYYANYLRFMERARTEWLRSLGMEQDVLIEEQGIIFAVRRAELDYIKPARFNDALEVSSTISDMRRVSFTFDQSVSRNDNGVSVELCRGKVQVACLDVETMRPRPLPEIIHTEIGSD